MRGFRRLTLRSAAARRGAATERDAATLEGKKALPRSAKRAAASGAMADPPSGRRLGAPRHAAGGWEARKGGVAATSGGRRGFELYLGRWSKQAAELSLNP